MTLYFQVELKKVVNLGPNEFLAVFNLTTSSGRLLETIEYSHIVCLVFNLSTTNNQIMQEMIQ